MIYITGDTHRVFERVEYFCDRQKTTKDDLLIILGDAGVNYYGGSDDRWVKEYLEALPITFMLVRGNHERRPSSQWPVRTIATDDYRGTFIIEKDFPSILYAMDGHTYDLKTEEGWKPAFVIGGAYSVDKYFRLGAMMAGNQNMKWFEDEQLSEEEMVQVGKEFENLLRLKRFEKIIVLSHTCPLSLEPTDMFLPQIDQSTVDQSMERFLDEIMLLAERYDTPVDQWYCGHWHTDRVGPDHLRFMFKDIIAL